jgi:hypothetical protein
VIGTLGRRIEPRDPSDQRWGQPDRLTANDARTAAILSTSSIAPAATSITSAYAAA